MSAPHGPDTQRQPAAAGTPHEPHDDPKGRMYPADVDVEASTWVRDGIVSGVLGAAVIALFFLVLDIFQGRPLWTPHALGSAVFLGELVEPDATPASYIVLGYTLLHGAAFVLAGLAASFALLGHRDRLGPLSGLLLAGALFFGLEVFFFTFFSFFSDSMASGLIGELGTGKIAIANVLAAFTVAASTLRPPLPHEREAGQRREGERQAHA